MNVNWDAEIDHERIKELETLVAIIRADVRELYANRGDDPVVAKYCESILAASSEVE